MPAAPNTKLITADLRQTTAAPAAAGAVVILTDTWGAAVAAFRPATAPPPPSPAITTLTPTAGLVGTPVTIAGTNFGTTQGSSAVTFNGTTATPTSWTATSLVVPVPPAATSGPVVVTVNGVPSNGATFTVTVPPAITNLTPTSAVVGTPITITGTNFGATQGSSTVTFNGTTATPTSWTATSLVVPVPPAATSGPVVVTVNSVPSNGAPFTVTVPPAITNLTPTAALVGTPITITGTNFGATQGSSTVTFNGTTATPTSWTATSLVVPVPAAATSGPVVVTVNGVPSNGVSFTVTPASIGISLVQRIGTDAGTTQSASLAFSSNNTGGNWIAVAIRAGQLGQVFTVTDTRGNTYRRAVQLDETIDTTSVALFYAETIAGGPNTVTVSDTVPNGTLRFAILEYSGIALTNSLDGTAAAQGTSTTPNSGPATTTSNGDLILGILTSANPQTFLPGTGFLIRALVPAAPGTTLAIEDSILAAAGPVSVTASLTSNDNWGAVLAAFKAANTPPTLTIGQPAAGATVFGTTVDIRYSVGGDLGAAAVDHVHFRLDAGPELMDLSLDGIYQLTNVAAGAHVLNAYFARSNHTKVEGTDAVPVNFSTALPDVTPPTVSLTAPADGTTVTGVTAISADASDNIGVAGVQFVVDDATPIGQEDTIPGYAVFFDTTSLGNGSHTFKAIARDLANNLTTSAPVSVTVSNADPNDPARIGQWSGPYSWPMIPIHMSVMPNSKVLTWDAYTNGVGVQLWDPGTNTFTAAPYDAANLFCAGLTTLADGRPILVGGHIADYIGIRNTTVFDYSSQTWSAAATMAYARWYPTVTMLGDGRILAVSGANNCPTCPQENGSRTGIAEIPEIYDPVANTWTQLQNAGLILPLYPHMFTLPDGRVLASSTSRDPIASTALDVVSQTWTTIDPTPVDGGAAAMYSPGKIIKVGRSRSPSYEAVPSTATAYVLDVNVPTPRWRRVQDMAFSRVYHNMTMLPDGTVLVTGGSRNSNVLDLNPAVLEAELWSPTTETWTTLARMQTPRLYHSTALLLPDGRVLMAAGGGGGAGVDQPNSEIFSPPYLFKGPRPSIAAAPAIVSHETTFFVETPDAARISAVSMIRLGSVTHAFDMGQVFVPLAFQAAEGGLDVQVPVSSNVAPPGDYMLFLIDTNGVPSVARILRVPVPTLNAQSPAQAGKRGISDLSGLGRGSW